MRILVIGSGGREHALIWKLSQSSKVDKIYCAPGNAGIASMAECLSMPDDDIPKLLDFALHEKIDLTVVGPEKPLSLGIVDQFESCGLKIFGPRKSAAILESSKCYTKEFCTRYKIPTAPYTVYYNAKDAKSVLKSETNFPVVIKADGLAQGKGVTVAKSFEEACQAVDDLLVNERFGEAGKKILIEKFLKGQEVTFMVATDGRDFVCLDTAQDHKRIGDGDTGPMTGGMGAYSPAPIVTPQVHQRIVDQIIKPTILGMQAEDRPYQGILYAGLMIEEGQPSLVEFNCRFGDPEAQAILFRMESDLVDLIEACLEERVGDYSIKYTQDSSVCVVMSSKGYPGPYEKGKLITGLDLVNGKKVFVFHAGTKKGKEGTLTHGGRVLGVTARGHGLKTAIIEAYATVKKISWEGATFRNDIGEKGL